MSDALSIRFTKGDDRDAIACTRPDGSTTWSRMPPSMVLHDLAHYAVETVLGLREGFYGMLLTGWDITAFNEPGSTSRIPREGLWTEHVVNLVIVDAVSQRFETLDEFAAALSEGLANAKLSFPRSVTPEELDAIRGRLADLRAKWAAVPQGGRLELSFEPL